MDSLLKQYGTWAVVTGASSGIGEAFSRLLAQQGFNLLIVARRTELLEEIRLSLENSYPIEVRVCVADLAVKEDVDLLIDQAKALDVGLLISNAGFGLKGKFVEDDSAQLRAMYLTNCVNASELIHALLPNLISKSRAGIIVTGSIEGESPFPLSAAYAASKAFMHSLTQSLWHELKPHNVDVLLLSPGSTDTEAPLKQGISRDQLVGVMTPEEVAMGALQKLGKTIVYIPGLHNRIFVLLLRLLPRKVAIKIAGFGLKRALDKSQRHPQ